MPLTVFVVDERGLPAGAPVTDPDDQLSRLLPPNDAESFHVLRHIDRYGDTVFNRLQIEPFLKEWDQIRANAHTPEQRKIVSSIEKLARSCRDGAHLYLKFAGD
jgi:hypothetical protein